MEVVAEGAAVLLCCYDHPLPAPLDALRPTGAAFGAGMVLGPAEAGLVGLTLGFRAGAAAPPPSMGCGLDGLAGTNAIARALPLLGLLARGEPGRVEIDYLDGHLWVEVSA